MTTSHDNTQIAGRPALHFGLLGLAMLLSASAGCQQQGAAIVQNEDLESISSQLLCHQDADCPSGQICGSGICGVGCTSNADCGTETCFSGICALSMTYTKDCRLRVRPPELRDDAHLGPYVVGIHSEVVCDSEHAFIITHTFQVQTEEGWKTLKAFPPDDAAQTFRGLGVESYGTCHALGLSGTAYLRGETAFSIDGSEEVHMLSAPRQVACVPTGTVTGIIYEGEPKNRLSDVTVKLGNKTVTTDATGKYTFQVMPGTYTLTASKAGFESSSVTRTVTSTNTVWGSMQLVRTP